MSTMTTSIDYSPIHAAVAALAGVCDYANSRDSRGFNGTDAWLGHALADMGAAAWDDEIALTAWDMIRKYRNTQLPEFGISYDELPIPPGAEELLEERRQDARDHAKDRVREHRSAQYRRSQSFVQCNGEGEEVVLKFKAEKSLFWTMVGESKVILGRKFKGSYAGHSDVNVYPFSSLSPVIEFADKYEIPVTPEVRALAEIAKMQHADALQAAEEAAAARAAMPHIRLDERGDLILDKPWDGDTKRLNEALRELNRGYSTWDKKASLHRPPKRNPEALKALIKKFGLTVSPEAQEVIDGELDRQAQDLADSMATTAEPLCEIRGWNESLPLKPQQWPPVRWGLKFRQTWFGDDMGLGKTPTSLAVVAIDDAYPLVIVCMPSLVGNWAKEVKRFLPRVNVFVAEGQKVKPIPPRTDVVIIGSAALGYAPRVSKGEPKVFPWVQALSRIRPKAIILDESQIAKEQSAARTQAVQELAAPIVEANGIALLLSGTALMNRPKELGPQVEAMGRIGVFGGMGAFLVRYCESERNEYGRKFDGAHRLDELYRILRTEGLMIRRDKSILGLPPCNEIDERIGLDQLDPAIMAEYFEAEQNVVDFLGKRAAKIAKRFGVDPHDARVRAAMKAQAAEHLVLINTLRGLVGRAKVDYAKRWVADKVARGEKVMVAAHHQEVTGPLAEAFGGLKIVGNQTIKAKEADKARFQEDPTAMVITVAVEAGGTGHTLTAARYGVLVEFPWTPGARNQMRDRFNRIGQEREMFFHTLIAEGTIDEHMNEVLNIKQERLDAVLNGKSSEGVEMDDESMASEVAWNLAMQSFGGRA